MKRDNYRQWENRDDLQTEEDNFDLTANIDVPNFTEQDRQSWEVSGQVREAGLIINRRAISKRIIEIVYGKKIAYFAIYLESLNIPGWNSGCFRKLVINVMADYDYWKGKEVLGRAITVALEMQIWKWAINETRKTPNCSLEILISDLMKRICLEMYADYRSQLGDEEDFFERTINQKVMELSELVQNLSEELDKDDFNFE